MTAMMPESRTKNTLRNLAGPIEREMARQNFDYEGATKSMKQSSAPSGDTPYRGATVVKRTGMAQLLSPADNSLKTTLG